MLSYLATDAGHPTLTSSSGSPLSMSFKLYTTTSVPGKIKYQSFSGSSQKKQMKTEQACVTATVFTFRSEFIKLFKQLCFCLEWRVLQDQACFNLVLKRKGKNTVRVTMEGQFLVLRNYSGSTMKLTFSNSRLDFAKGFLEETSQEGMGTTTFYQEKQRH